MGGWHWRCCSRAHACDAGKLGGIGLGSPNIRDSMCQGFQHDEEQQATFSDISTPVNFCSVNFM